MQQDLDAGPRFEAGCPKRLVALTEIALPNGQAIRVAETILNAGPAIDIRLCTDWRSLGEIGPTSIGIKVPKASLPALIDALQAASR